MAKPKRRKLIKSNAVSGFTLEGTNSSPPVSPPKLKGRRLSKITVARESILAEAQKRKERKGYLAYRAGPEMKKRFLDLFIKEVGVEFLQKRWSDGYVDLTMFLWEDMSAIANGFSSTKNWDRAKETILATVRPARTIPPNMVLYDQSKAPKTEKKNLNPMALTQAKAHSILQDAIDLLDETIEEELDGVVVEFLRSQQISPMIASMMLNSFMTDFEPDEDSPEIFPGEYSLETQSVRCQVLAEQLKQYAEEARNQKRTKTSKRVTSTRKGIKIGQAEKALKTFKYEKVNDQHKLSSVDPEKIFGAAVVLLYNTKYGRVTYLEAIPLGVLSLKGSSIIGFNKETTIWKACRDPKKLLNWKTKAKSKKSVKDLRGKQYIGNGRSNANTIILAVFK